MSNVNCQACIHVRHGNLPLLCFDAPVDFHFLHNALAAVVERPLLLELLRLTETSEDSLLRLISTERI